MLEVIANSMPLHRLSPRSIHWEVGGNSTQTFTDVVLASKTFHRQSSSNLPANVQRDQINDITKAFYFHTIALAQRVDHHYSLFINAWIANIFLLIIERRSGNDVQMIYPARKFAAWMVDLASNKLYDALAAGHEAKTFDGQSKMPSATWAQLVPMLMHEFIIFHRTGLSSTDHFSTKKGWTWIQWRDVASYSEPKTQHTSTTKVPHNAR